jgi:hypothetical protein
MSETRSRKARNARNKAKARLNQPDLPLKEDLSELQKFLALHTDISVERTTRMIEIVDTCSLWLQKPKNIEQKYSHSKTCLECTRRLSQLA